MNVETLSISNIELIVKREGEKINIYEEHPNNMFDKEVRIGSIKRFNNGEYYFCKSYMLNHVTHKLIKDLDVIMTTLHSQEKLYNLEKY